MTDTFRVYVAAPAFELRKNNMAVAMICTPSGDVETRLLSLDGPPDALLGHLVFQMILDQYPANKGRAQGWIQHFNNSRANGSFEASFEIDFDTIIPETDDQGNALGNKYNRI